MAGLRLDSRAGAVTGGKSGPAIVPGKPDDSLLVQAVAHTHARLKMPPAGKLEPHEVENLRQWVRDGAVWPDSGAAVTATYTIGPEQKMFWSFQPVRKPEVPSCGPCGMGAKPNRPVCSGEADGKADCPRPAGGQSDAHTPGDVRFNGAAADSRTGSGFVADKSPDAFAKGVDRMLASPQYGERWGRHWLDLVRYADTAGDASDYPVPEMYKYRNYVIDAFHQRQALRSIHPRTDCG